MDLSEQHAYEARQALLATVSKGEARMDLAEAALQVSSDQNVPDCICAVCSHHMRY